MLLACVASGDTRAHRILVDRHRARVASFVRRHLRDPGLRQEVVSDVFLAVWRNASAYRGESSVVSWIAGIARFRTLCARRFQKQRKRAVLVLTSDGVIERAVDPYAEEALAARDELRRVLRAIEELSQCQRDVVTLVFLMDRSYGEAASALGITEANVKTRVKRARDRLRVLVRGAA